MTVFLIRFFFVLIAALIGYQIVPIITGGFGVFEGLYGVFFGGLIGLIVICVEMNLARVSLRGLSAAVFGLLLALLVSKLLTNAIDILELEETQSAVIKLTVVLVLAYLGMTLGIRGKDEFHLIIPYVKLHPQRQSENLVILDTSAIIDGRISDIGHTRFLEGYFLIPKFVLKELQVLADASDPIKRARGRRGLEILNQLQKDPKILLRIHEEDFPDLSDVDEKLVRLAKILEGRIVTNDYNLNRVAQLQGIPILNLHELSQALRPVLLPGEKIEVNLTKEGKERDQAVAYLNDGTMVVVEKAKPLIGSTLEVVVTSVLQTAAGRMVFAKIEGSHSS